MQKNFLWAIGLCLISSTAFAETDTAACNRYLDAGDYKRAMQRGKKAVQVKPKEIAGHLCVARVYKDNGDPANALAVLKKMEKIASGKDDLRQIAYYLGAVYTNTGNREEALRQYQRCLDLSRELGDDEGIASALTDLGNMHSEVGEFGRAFQYYEESLQYAGDYKNMGRRYHNLAQLYLAKRELKKSVDYLLKAIYLSERGGDFHGAATSRISLSDVYKEQKRYDEARAELENGLAAIQKLGDRGWQATAYMSLAQLARDTGKIPEARSSYEKAMAIYQQIGSRDGLENARQSLDSLNELNKK